MNSLVVNTAGAGRTTFNGVVGGTDRLSSLITNADGDTLLNGGTVNLNGASATFNDPVLLGVDTTINEAGTGNITFNNTVNSEAGEFNDLAVNTGAGATIFNGAVGTTDPVARSDPRDVLAGD